MKILKYFSILLLFGNSPLPGLTQIHFFPGTLAEAQQKARQEKKLLFVDFYTTWCGPCKLMDREVFTLPEIGRYFDEKYIACRIDAEKEADKSTLKKYDVQAFPCMVFMDADGKELKKIKGAVAPGIFLSEAKIVAGDELPYEKLYAKYQKNKKQTELAAELLLKAPYFISTCGEYEHQKWSVRIEALFKDYVKYKGLKNMVNADDFYLISRFHTSPGKDDPIFNFVTDHYTDYIKVADRREVSDYIIGLNNSKIIRLCKAGNKDYKKELEHLDGSLKEVYADVKFGDLSVKEVITYLADATFCLYRNDENGFFTNQDRYFEAVGDSLSVGDYTQPLLEMYTVNQGKMSANAQRKAIEWCSKALEKEMTAAMRTRLLIIMGECYQGTGDRTKAKQALNQAFLISAQIQDEIERLGMQQAIRQNLENL